MRLSSKLRIAVHEYRSGGIGHVGWFLKRGLTERVHLSSHHLSRLIQEGKAELLIDKKIWDDLVKKYRGQATSAEALKQQREQLMSEHRKRHETLHGELKQHLEAYEKHRKKVAAHLVKKEHSQAMQHTKEMYLHDNAVKRLKQQMEANKQQLEQKLKKAA